MFLRTIEDPFKSKWQIERSHNGIEQSFLRRSKRDESFPIRRVCYVFKVHNLINETYQRLTFDKRNAPARREGRVNEMPRREIIEVLPDFSMSKTRLPNEARALFTGNEK